jgi:pimeloyl-ACP methyl ester carboxylesterase
MYPLLTNIIYILFLLRLIPTTAKHHVGGGVETNNNDSNDDRRILQTQTNNGNDNVRDCNEEFSFVTTDEIRSIFNFLMESIAPVDDTSSSSSPPSSSPTQRQQAVVDPILNYDVTVSKVCLKCSQIGLKDFFETTEEILLNTSPYGFPSYCSEDKYGWDTTHSALIFSPVDSETGQILTGELRGFVSGHDTAIDVDTAPTDLWPFENVTSILLSSADSTPLLTDSEKHLLFQSFISSLVAASGGTVAIMPDYIGYGESKDYDRAYLAPTVYEQSAAVSYAAAKRYVSQISNGCTVLIDEATIVGYGEGGYFAIRGALALEQNGVTILSSRPGGTPLELDTQLGFALSLDEAKSSSSAASQLLLAFFAYSYSNNFSFLSNSNNTEQVALHPSWMSQTDSQRNIVDWFDSSETLTTTDILSLLPANSIQDILNAALVDLYKESIYEGYPNACTEGIFVTDSTRVLCDAILDAGLWNILLNEINFPISICHSPQDDVIGFDNIPDPTALPPNIKFYNSNMEILNPRGGHYESMFFCALDPITYIASQDPDGQSSPILRAPLSNPPDQCGGSVITTTDNNIPVLLTESPTPSSAPLSYFPTSSSSSDCSPLYGGCDDTIQRCCANLSCKSRPSADGMRVNICSPISSRSSNRVSIAGDGAGGSNYRVSITGDDVGGSNRGSKLF